MFWFDKVLVTFSCVKVIFYLQSERFIFSNSYHILQKLSPEPILQLFKCVLPRLLHPVFPKIFEDKSSFFDLRSHYIPLVKFNLFIVRAFIVFGNHW
jgi:hypothetical protein